MAARRGPCSLPRWPATRTARRRRPHVARLPRHRQGGGGEGRGRSAGWHRWKKNGQQSRCELAGDIWIAHVKRRSVRGTAGREVNECHGRLTHSCSAGPRGLPSHPTSGPGHGPDHTHMHTHIDGFHLEHWCSQSAGESAPCHPPRHASHRAWPALRAKASCPINASHHYRRPEPINVFPSPSLPSATVCLISFGPTVG